MRSSRAWAENPGRILTPGAPAPSPRSAVPMSGIREAVHRDPVWRDRSNFIIGAAIDPGDTNIATEQLWCGCCSTSRGRFRFRRATRRWWQSEASRAWSDMPIRRHASRKAYAVIAA